MYKMTVNDMVEAIIDALRHWYDLHTDPETWAGDLTEDIQFSFRENRGIVQNAYYSFDWKAAALKRLADDWADSFTRCPFCGCISENGYEDCCDEWKEKDYEDGEDVTGEELVDWLNDIGDDGIIPDNILWDAITNEGYEAYWKGVGPVVEGCCDEVKIALESLDNAPDNLELLKIAIASAHLAHVFGTILEDYGDCDAWKLAGGCWPPSPERLVEIGSFTREEIDEYIMQDPPEGYEPVISLFETEV